MSKTLYSISFIGAENVATHLAHAFYLAGFQIVEVYSRNLKTAQELASTFDNAIATDKLDMQKSKADLFIIAVPDYAISHIVEKKGTVR